MSVLIVIFTDLDGTLLDHNNHTFEPATRCLKFIRTRNIPLIFTSSKTAIEIEDLCVRTNLYHPYIAENGGLLSIPNNYFSTKPSSSSTYDKKLIGQSRKDINSVLQDLSKCYKFKFLNDMTIKEIMDVTGLNKKQAYYSNQRECSEPILWQDSQDVLQAFSKHLENYNLQLLSGGRFHHVMGKHDKATTMSLLLKCFQKHFDKNTLSIALGDSPNDFKMLRAADYGIVIPNPGAPKQCLDNTDHLIYATSAGPQGWNDSLIDLLKELV